MVKPFLKWAGNKYQIIRSILAVLETVPASARLVEPFVGSGAVFLNTDFRQNLLGDNNSDLINLYQTLQREGDAFIDYCRTFFVPENNTADQFYAFRTLFNQTTDKHLRAALFLYLNRHCFNGLCRYNSQGEFNVPFGRYKKPYFPQGEMAAFLQKAPQAVFLHDSFEILMQMVCPGDVVYCDPPYVPLSRTAQFTSYSAGGFSLDQQERLARLAVDAAQRGAYVLISNHNTPLTQSLYQGATIYELSVQRFISCNGANRGKAKELLALFTRAGLEAAPAKRYATGH